MGMYIEGIAATDKTSCYVNARTVENGKLPELVAGLHSRRLQRGRPRWRPRVPGSRMRSADSACPNIASGYSPELRSHVFSTRLRPVERPPSPRRKPRGNRRN